MENPRGCGQSELTYAYAVQALETSELAAAQAHIAWCRDCQRELDSLGPLIDSLVSWPIDILRPGRSLEARLALQIAEQSGNLPVQPPLRKWSEPLSEQVASGIKCKVLASDTAKHRVSVLVRLAPDASYPPHTHAGVEELHLLDGELWIDERKLFAGDYNHGAPGASDQRVWSETGCTCLLVTSTEDILC